MDKKKILSLLVSSIIFSTSLFGWPSNIVSAQKVISPNLNWYMTKHLENKNGTRVTDYSLEVLKDTGKNGDLYLYITINKSYVAVDGYYFVVAIDKNNNIIKKQMLDYDENLDVDYTTLQLPYKTDQVDLHFYEQGGQDEDFVIREEKFIGRSKVFIPNMMIGDRGGDNTITVYDKHGYQVDFLGEKFFLNRLVPNYYTIKTNRSFNNGEIGKIVLKKEQEHLMSEEDKIVQIGTYLNMCEPVEEEDYDKAREANYDGFNFYIPEEVTEFKFIVYNVAISDDPNDILYQYNIKINRK